MKIMLNQNVWNQVQPGCANTNTETEILRLNKYRNKYKHNYKYSYKYENKQKYNQVDEEKKVEAVRDFYDNAVGDDVAVERLQAIGK